MTGVDTDGWEARVLDVAHDFAYDSRTVVIRRRISDTEAEAITGFDDRGHPIVTRYEIMTTYPEPLLKLPYGAIEALGEAIRPGPANRELARLEEAWAIERARVDRVLDAHLGGGA